MLTRILTDNPAKSFTKNIDSKFVATVKELLRDGRDMSVQQILRETLDYFEAEKLPQNETLAPLMEMWKKEKSKASTRKYDNPPVGGSEPSVYYIQLTFAAWPTNLERSSIQSTATTAAELLLESKTEHSISRSSAT